MSRAVRQQHECGCVSETQQIPRSMQTREVWTELCVAHDAEFKANHVAAEQSYRVTEAERELRREFTT